MEQEFELAKAAPWGLQEELLHSEEWTTHVEEAVGSCLGDCQWVRWACQVIHLPHML
jgi:hypothetical protein